MALFDFVQVKNGGSAAPAVVAFDSNTVAGNSIVVGVEFTDGTATDTTIVDDIGSTYNKAATVMATVLGGDFRFEIWMASAVAGGATTVTVTPGTGDGGSVFLSMVEYEGALEIDQFSADDGVSQVLDSGLTPTTTAANELLVGFYANNFGSTTPGESFTERADLGDGIIWIRNFCDKVVAATGTYKITADTGFAASTWFATIATFKQAGGGGGGFLLVKN